ncbi:MAG: hypothetical protein R2825_03840 [Saprospiraceae bacterium]
MSIKFSRKEIPQQHLSFQLGPHHFKKEEYGKAKGAPPTGSTTMC